MKRTAWQLVAGWQWCQTCKEWIPPVEGGVTDGREFFELVVF